MPGAGTDQEVDEAMSDMAWEGHRKRQLRNLGIDPEELDAGDSQI